MTFWHAAYDHMLIDQAPRQRLIRRLPEEVDPPEAWTWQQVGELVVTATTVPGYVAGTPSAD